MTSQDTRRQGRRRRLRRPSRLTIGLFVATIIVGILFAFLDLEDAWQALRSADVRWVVTALLLSGISYLFLAFSFGWIFTRMGIRVPFRTMSFIGYTSASVNHLMPLPIVTGHGIRLALLRDRDVPPGDTLAASTFHTYLSSFVLLTFFPIGLFLLIAMEDLPPAAVVPIVAIGAVTLVVLVGMTLFVFQTRVRRWLVARLGRLAERFLRGDVVRRTVLEFDQTIRLGVRLLSRHPRTLLIAVLLDLADWTFSALTLAACLWAFGVTPSVGILLTGFVVGIVVGLQSVIPGGLGIQEASFVGIFVLLGLPFHVVVLAAFLFRVVYHFVPFTGGLIGYTRLMRRRFHLGDVQALGEQATRS